MTKAEELVELLRKKYPSPAYAVLEQVRSTTGYAKEIRTCDAMVMSLWGSRGIHLSGFEIKASRSDWMSEVKHPLKAEDFQSQCHYWYLLTYDDQVAQMDEIPRTWGWIAKKNGTLKLLKEAPINPTAKIDHYLLASVFRNVTEGHLTMKQHRELLEKDREQQKKYDNINREEFIKRLKDFETKSGIKLIEENRYGYAGYNVKWEAGNIGEAVRMVLASEHIYIKRKLEMFREDLEEMLESTNKALGKLNVEAKLS